LVIPPPPAGGPERGHGATRLGLGAVTSRQDGSALMAEGRLALHDLADPPAGFSPRTQIEFFKLRLSVADRRRAVRLEEASLVEVTSLNAMDRFERRISWKMRVGATRVASFCSSTLGDTDAGVARLAGHQMKGRCAAARLPAPPR